MLLLRDVPPAPVLNNMKKKEYEECNFLAASGACLRFTAKCSFIVMALLVLLRADDQKLHVLRDSTKTLAGTYSVYEDIQHKAWIPKQDSSIGVLYLFLLYDNRTQMYGRAGSAMSLTMVLLVMLPEGTPLKDGCLGGAGKKSTASLTGLIPASPAGLIQQQVQRSCSRRLPPW